MCLQPLSLNENQPIIRCDTDLVTDLVPLTFQKNLYNTYVLIRHDKHIIQTSSCYVVTRPTIMPNLNLKSKFLYVLETNSSFRTTTTAADLDLLEKPNSRFNFRKVEQMSSCYDAIRPTTMRELDWKVQLPETDLSNIVNHCGFKFLKT